jgi:Fe-S cluster biogenesis protein NfuA
VISSADRDRLTGYTIDFRDDRFVTLTNVTVHVKETPNPASRKFMVNRPLVTAGSATFTRPVAEDHPVLVKLLFEIPEVHSLFFINDFVSVTQEPGTAWDGFQTTVGQRIQAYFAHGGTALTPPPVDQELLGDVERKILEVLEDVVRPAVQRDGGDIAFAGYEEGTVQLYMLGSCSGCPSSMATLKMGVENLLKDAVPEIREVVAID